LQLCRKLGIEIDLSKKEIVTIPTEQGPRTLKPNASPSHTALLLATILEHHHFSFFVIDPPQGFPKAARRMLKEKLQSKPRILALSTTFVIDSRDIRHMMRMARKYSPQTRIVVGGQYLLTARKSVDEMREADVFVIGECEDNLVPVVEALIHGNHEALNGIRGILYRRDGKLVRTPPSPAVDLERSLPIQWSLMNDFFPPRREYSGFSMIEDGRGCAFQCSYCSFRKNFPFRLKSIEKVIAELKSIPQQPGGASVFFASSTFTFPKERAMELADRIIEENLAHRFGGYGRVQDISEELVEKLRAANFCWLFFGLESMDAEVLRLARKMSAPDQMDKAVRMSVEAGIIADCSFVVGLPGETRDSAKKIAGFLKKPYVGRYCLFPLLDMDTSDLATQPEAYRFQRQNLARWAHPGMSSKEVPRVMAEIITDAHEAGHSYSSFIIDALIGNQLSAAPLTSVWPPDARPFYLAMEKGTVLFLQKILKGVKMDRDELRAIVTELKQTYLPKVALLARIRERIRLSAKILVLRVFRSYLLKKEAT
jgi:hypothetical protein